ncbi:MAG: tetratricopeptide repeat protein [Bacteroidota bacterium]
MTNRKSQIEIWNLFARLRALRHAGCYMICNLFFGIYISLAQNHADTTVRSNPETDSLLRIAMKKTVDTIKINALNILALKTKNIDPDSAKFFVDEALKYDGEARMQKQIARSHSILGIILYMKGEFNDALEHFRKTLEIEQDRNNRKGIASAYNGIGAIYTELDEYDKALEYYLKAMGIMDELGDKKGIAEIYNNIGFLHYSQGNYVKALEYFLKDLKITESIGNKQDLSATYNNIGLVYKSMGDINKALEYYLKDLEIAEEFGDKYGMAGTYNNIGLIYLEEDNYDMAKEYFLSAISIREEMGDQQGLAQTYSNIGLLYSSVADSLSRSINVSDHADSTDKYYNISMQYQVRALDIQRAIDDKKGVVYSLNGIAKIYSVKGNYFKALDYYNESIMLAEWMHSKKELKDTHKCLADLYASLGESVHDKKKKNDFFQKAYENHFSFSSLHDSLFNEEKSKEIGKLEARYEMEKKLAEEKRTWEEQTRIEAEAKARQDILQYSGILIFIVLLGAGLLALGRLNVPVRWAEGIVFFTFLLFFEFALVLLDPYIERFSAGAPAIKLACNAVLAALIFPLHSFFEELLKRRIINRRKIL